MKRIIKALGYSLSGLAAAWRDEAAFREEIMLAVVLLPAAFFLAPSSPALACMVGSVLLVLIVELLNTAVEAVIDRVGPERHPESKKAKDVGSAAVLVALLNMTVVWAVCLLR